MDGTPGAAHVIAATIATMMVSASDDPTQDVEIGDSGPYTSQFALDTPAGRIKVTVEDIS